MKHVIVCGAGAAGLTAGIFAAESGAKVTLLERTDKAGKKILMSGGTRCNVLPVTMRQTDYFTESSKNRMKNIFKSWSLEACKDWFEKDLGLKLACEIESNKWFPASNSAKEVRDKLVQKAQWVGVAILYEKKITALRKDGLKWIVEVNKVDQFKSDSVIIATGGLSVPTTGTDGLGHKVIRKAGLQHTELYAALTPLTTKDEDLKQLAGVSLNVLMDVYVGGKKQVSASRSGFLFTHRGFSGPAVLDVSHHAVIELERGGQLPVYKVNWNGMSREEWETILKQEKGLVRNAITKHLPARLAQLLCRKANIEDDKAPELRKEKRKKLLEVLTEYQLPVDGHEGYRKAEVTGGGVPLEMINTATMEVEAQPGLFLCGEVLDVFGRIGGFNFYWAWVTGRLAGISSSKSS